MTKKRWPPQVVPVASERPQHWCHLPGVHTHPCDTAGHSGSTRSICLLRRDAAFGLELPPAYPRSQRRSASVQLTGRNQLTFAQDARSPSPAIVGCWAVQPSAALVTTLGLRYRRLTELQMGPFFPVGRQANPSREDSIHPPSAFSFMTRGGGGGGGWHDPLMRCGPSTAHPLRRRFPPTKMAARDGPPRATEDQFTESSTARKILRRRPPPPKFTFWDADVHQESSDSLPRDFQASAPFSQMAPAAFPLFMFLPRNHRPPARSRRRNPSPESGVPFGMVWRVGDGLVIHAHFGMFMKCSFMVLRHTAHRTSSSLLLHTWGPTLNPPQFLTPVPGPDQDPANTKCFHNVWGTFSSKSPFVALDNVTMRTFPKLTRDTFPFQTISVKVTGKTLQVFRIQAYWEPTQMVLTSLCNHHMCRTHFMNDLNERFVQHWTWLFLS